MAIELHNIVKCKACGAEKVKGLVACSLFGAFTGAWCEECLRIGRDSYDLMVDYIASAGRWPDGINEVYQCEVRRQLRLHDKTEEEFKKDIDKIIEFLRSDMPTTYIVLDTIGTEGDF
jgi:hypothetical protein